MAGNIRLEVVCETALAEAIATAVREAYFDDYAMILFIGEVSVLRSDKF